MDAANLLKRQGWRGLGHSLDNNDRGIARPLLITRRQEGRGLGSQKTQPSDQWWMRAYDTGLKELGTGKQTELSTVSQNAGRSSLYMSFVKGGLLPGTMDQLNSATEASSSSTSASENSTTATTPEPDLAAKNKTKHKANVSKSENKRKHIGQQDGRKKDRSTPEDPMLLRRAAKKALRLKRASKAAELADGLVSDADRDTAAGSNSTRKKRKRSGPDADDPNGKTATADSAPSVSEGISNDKMKKYAAKAAAKGMTVEAYLGKKAKSKGKASK